MQSQTDFLYEINPTFYTQFRYHKVQNTKGQTDRENGVAQMYLAPDLLRQQVLGSLHLSASEGELIAVNLWEV